MEFDNKTRSPDIKDNGKAVQRQLGQTARVFTKEEARQAGEQAQRNLRNRKIREISALFAKAAIRKDQLS